MRRLLFLAVLLGLSWGQDAPNPTPPTTNTQPPPQTNPPTWLQITKEERGPIWLYLPTIQDQNLAEALKSRAFLRRPTYILLETEDLKNPLSYSLTVFIAQIKAPDVYVVRLIQSKTPGKPFLLTRDVALEGEEAIPEGKRAAYSRWWQEAWKRGLRADPVKYARDVLLGRTPKIVPWNDPLGVGKSLSQER